MDTTPRTVEGQIDTRSRDVGVESVTAPVVHFEDSDGVHVTFVAVACDIARKDYFFWEAARLSDTGTGA